MYFYFLNKYPLKILENKFLILFKYNISSKLLHELLYLGFEYSFIYNYSLNLQDFSNFIYLLILYKCKINNIYNLKYSEMNYNYINIFVNNYYYLKLFYKIQMILNDKIYIKINPIYSNLYFFYLNKIKIKYSQLQQLIGYKGYISNIQGIIYEKPIINNYINELNLYEYILACYGSKKGIIDTALKTADSGYLTKRLVNITNNFIIKELDCKVPYMFRYFGKIDIYGNIIFPINILKYKLLQNNIFNKYNGSLLYVKNIYITKYIINKLYSILYNKYIYLNLKSLYLCSLFNGICNNCLNYIHLYKYNLGQNIGVIASSAIGEPGTQMVLRTFHASSILKFKYSDYNFNICNIFKLYKYKLNIKKIFKILFIYKQCKNFKNNLIFMFNKLLFNISKIYNYNQNKYFIYNQYIFYNYIYNSISKNFKYNYYNIIKQYLRFMYVYYNNNIIQLLIKNIYNKWIIYNLYTYYIYLKYINLYILNSKGIIYTYNIYKKYNIIFLVKSFINYLSNFYYYNYINIIYNNILHINYCKKLYRFT